MTFDSTTAYVLNFCLKELGGKPKHEYILNHEILCLAQEMGLELCLKLNFHWVDEGFQPAGPRSTVLPKYIIFEDIAVPKLVVQATEARLKDACRSIRQRLEDNRPQNMSAATWRQLLLRVVWDKPIASEHLFYRRLATTTLYGTGSSRYDRILDAVV